jgi:hypothetical protein
MKRIQVLFIGLIAVGIFVAGAAGMGPDNMEVGFVPLFNGKDFTGIKQVGVKEDTFRVEDGMIVCTGKPNGYWYTDKSYKNYILRLEWRFKRPDGLKDDADFKGNSGYLQYITGEHKVWPKCIEVQGMNRDAGKVLAIGGAPKIKTKDDPEARKKALKPVGEWNELEVISLGGTLISRLNGQVVGYGFSTELTSGPIGFQSEGAEIHWRNVRIKELPE